MARAGASIGANELANSSRRRPIFRGGTNQLAGFAWLEPIFDAGANQLAGSTGRTDAAGCPVRSIDLAKSAGAADIFPLILS